MLHDLDFCLLVFFILRSKQSQHSNVQIIRRVAQHYHLTGYKKMLI